MPLRARAQARPVKVLVFLCLAYFALGFLLVVRTPLWQNPDEPAHFHTVAEVARTGWTTEAHTSEPRSYESLQPPLYYFVAAPIKILVDGSVHREVLALRFQGLVIGALGIPLTYLIAQQILRPSMVSNVREDVALGAAALVALLPQAIAINASVNNDSLANVLSALLVWTGFRFMNAKRTRLVDFALIGLAIAALLLTKLTAVSSVLIAGLATVVVLFRLRLSIRDRIIRLSLLIGIPLVAITPWLASNLVRYEDPLGHSRFMQFADDLYDLARWGDDPPRAFVLFLVRSHDSFWARLGWMSTPPARGVQLFLLAATVAAVLGATIYLSRKLRTPDHPKIELWMLVGWVTLQLAWFVWFNVGQFFQPQGRYLFPALAGIAIMFVAGWLYWVSPRSREEKGARWALWGVAVSLIVLNLFVQLEQVPRIPSGPCPICPGGDLLEGADMSSS